MKFISITRDDASNTLKLTLEHEVGDAIPDTGGALPIVEFTLPLASGIALAANLWAIGLHPTRDQLDMYVGNGAQLHFLREHLSDVRALGLALAQANVQAAKATAKQ